MHGVVLEEIDDNRGAWRERVPENERRCDHREYFLEENGNPHLEKMAELSLHLSTPVRNERYTEDTEYMLSVSATVLSIQLAYNGSDL